MDAIDILNEQHNALREHRAHVLATIVRVDGSTPRESGKMLVYADGSTFGTVGGGAAELLVIRDAQDCLLRRENRLQTYDMTSDASGRGLMCGGRITVYLEVFSPRPLLVMCGAGHVGAAVLRAARFVGFDTLLLDERDPAQIAAVTALADRFVPVRQFEQEFRQMQLPKGACYVLATHSHALDGAVLGAALEKDAAYIGMIGSRKKREAIYEKLRAQGVTPEQLAAVHCPIGLDLGGQTPEEIAIAIVAEILSVRYRGGAKRTPLPEK